MCQGLPGTLATRHFGIKALWDTSAPISRHFDTKNVVRDTSTRVLWSRKSWDTSTQDNSDETQLHRRFVLNFGTNFVVPKCLGAELPCGRSVRLPCQEWRPRYYYYYYLCLGVLQSVVFVGCSSVCLWVCSFVNVLGSNMLKMVGDRVSLPMDYH